MTFQSIGTLGQFKFLGEFCLTEQHSLMSKLFRFSKSLGKNNGKKWSQEVVSDLKTFAHKGCKIAAAKKVFFLIFFSFGFLFTLCKCISAPTSRSPISKKNRYSGFLGKSNGKKWSQIWKGAKLPRKKVFFLANFASLAGLFWYWCYYPHRSRDAKSPVWAIPCQRSEKKGQSRKVDYFWWNVKDNTSIWWFGRFFLTTFVISGVFSAK